MTAPKNPHYSRWCRMPSAAETAAEVDALLARKAAAPTFAVGARVFYDDHGDAVPGEVVAVDGDRYQVRVLTPGHAWRMWCSGADLRAR